LEYYYTFGRVFNDIKSEKQLVYQMLQIIMKEINKKHLEFEHMECKDHYIFMAFFAETASCH